ncbi:MAG: tetratricopeptide repeat protein [Gemmataceae bacterium]|nr:tetratricopeptide repeat protein [Gemmataceae bacterium]MCI0739307.1 tetratricopeptide repeat protein [Gemmataceae bacterium]
MFRITSVSIAMVGQTFLSAIAIVILVVSTCAAGAGEATWTGKTIVIKRPGVKFGYTDDDGKQVYLGTLDQLSYVCTGEDNGWLKAVHGDQYGWFDKVDAVLLEDAVAYFTKAIERTPKDPSPYVRRAWAWRLVGDWDKAIADQSEALRLNPKVADWWNTRGSLWFQKKEFDKALSDHEEALKLNPKDAATLHSVALAWMRKKDFSQALANLDRALAIDGKLARALNSKAWLLATCPDDKIRNGAEAVALAKKACELTNNKIIVYLGTLAAAHAEAGQFEEAVRLQERALENAEYRRDWGEDAQDRLELYRQKKAYRQE